jgi:hypothetical protein
VRVSRDRLERAGRNTETAVIASADIDVGRLVRIELDNRPDPAGFGSQAAAAGTAAVCVNVYVDLASHSSNYNPMDQLA